MWRPMLSQRASYKIIVAMLLNFVEVAEIESASKEGRKETST